MKKLNCGAERLIGKTPILRLFGVEKYFGLGSRIFAKWEAGNLTGSVKDRAACFMLRSAEREGKLTSGGTVVEATSGNLGISIAALCSTMGYKSHIVMPKSSPSSRKRLIESYGGQVILTDGGMAEAATLARSISAEISDSLYLDQFNNPHNALAHFYGTGVEIYNQMQSQVDIFVCGVGSSGSFSGIGRLLKNKNPNVRLIAVEPSESAVLSGGVAGSHKIYGIGAGFVPPLFDFGICSEIATVCYEEAELFVKAVAKTDGLLVGISSGAALSVAVKTAKEQENKNIVTLFADGGERYL